jgi:hypothetical protein
MKKRMVRYFLVMAVSLGVLLVLITRLVAAEEQMKLPPARKIPALTAEDKFPKGCVDCHINMPQIKQDERISTLMARWNKDAGPKLLKKAQAAAPASVTLAGKHPAVPSSLKDIPKACMACHTRNSKTAPPLAEMLHTIHLTGGDENHFLTIFQGECTHCHKLNVTTGAWTMPSGPEK